MILAINLNAALDRALFIERFNPSTHMRALKSELYIGGKGLDTALVLHTLGVNTLAVSFIAGRNGETLAALLEANHIPHELVWLGGETREAVIIVESSRKRHSHITTNGYSVSPEDCDRFLDKIDALSSQAQWGVMAGSLPHGVHLSYYAEIIKRLKKHGAKSLIDHSGPAMIAALEISPDIAKMNLQEFQETFGVTCNNRHDLVRMGLEQKHRFHLNALVVTCGAEGMIAFTPEGNFHAGCDQPLDEVNAAGAGDAASAALVSRLSMGETWPQALAWAAATSAAVVLTEGTAACHMSDILAIHPNTRVQRIQDDWTEKL